MTHIIEPYSIKAFQRKISGLKLKIIYTFKKIHFAQKSLWTDRPKFLRG